MGERRFDPQQIGTDYLRAYKSANPSSEPPEIAYDRGWFTLRYRGRPFGTKHRASDIQHMTGRLDARAAQRDKQEVEG